MAPTIGGTTSNWTDVAPRVWRFRLMITVDSPADAAATERIVADALRLSSWANTLAREQRVTADLEIAGNPRRRSITALEFSRHPRIKRGNPG